MDILDADAAASNDFQDWELLQSSTVSSTNAFTEIDSAAPALLHPDYFSLHDNNPSAAAAPPLPPAPELDDDKSASSDNPSWIDPASDDNPTRYLHKDPGGFWSDSSSEPSQDPKFSDFDAKNETDFPDNHHKEAGMGEPLHQIAQDDQGLGIFHSDSAGHQRCSAQADDVVVDNSRVNYVGGTNLHGHPEVCGEGENENKSAGGGNIVDAAGNKRAGGDVGKRSVVWWKMPMDVLRYCIFKMSPVWAVSVAAAVMGFVILGRKLYKMKKKKTRGLEIKLTVDDKKISQVMNHANRLNDAFSIVKRVPMIRPSLPPAVGTATSWSMASLR